MIAADALAAIPDLYGKANTQLYRNGIDKKKVPPHIFAVADNAFQAVSATTKDQVR